MEQLYFNASMPWSGSELLQCLLGQHPDVYASATSPLLEYQFAARGNRNLPEVLSQDPELMDKAFIEMCGSMAEGYYSALTDKDVVVDKNRGWSHYYEWAARWNSNPKMLCMVRDLRDTVASAERTYRKNRDKPVGPDNPAQLQNMTVGQRANHWLNTQPLGLALQRTADCFQRDVAKNMLFVRYEDLCSDPEETMDRVWEYLEMDAPEHDFDSIVKQVEEDSSHFGVYGCHDVAPKIRPYKPGRWQEVLPPDVARAIVLSNQWFQQMFNY